MSWVGDGSRVPIKLVTQQPLVPFKSFGKMKPKQLPGTSRTNNGHCLTQIASSSVNHFLFHDVVVAPDSGRMYRTSKNAPLTFT